MHAAGQISDSRMIGRQLVHALPAFEHFQKGVMPLGLDSDGEVPRTQKMETGAVEERLLHQLLRFLRIAGTLIASVLTHTDSISVEKSTA